MASKYSVASSSSQANVRNVFLINDVKEWLDVESKFRESIDPIGAIGLDCEWVTPENFVQKDQRDFTVKYYEPKVDERRRLNAAQGKVSLLQMATHEGMTLLIRLCLFDEVPPTLKELLEDATIVKLGVNIELDVKKLFTTWGVLVISFVDIRNVFGHNRRFLDEYKRDGLGLKHLGAFFTKEEPGVDKKKNTIRFSNWAAKRLYLDQVDYASKDARMAIDSMIAFGTTYIEGIPQSKTDPNFWPMLRSRLLNHIDRPCDTNLTNFAKGETIYDEEEDQDPVPGPSSKSRARHYEPLDTSKSDVELDFAGWRKTKDYNKLARQSGADRAVLFYEIDQRGNQGKPLAAIDAAFLTTMVEGGRSEASLRFKVKLGNGGDGGNPEVHVTLFRENSKK